MNWTRTAALTVVGVAIGASAVVAFNKFRQLEMVTATFRPGVMSTGAELLDKCDPPPFTAARHPTQMIQIELPGTFDPRNLQPVMTQMGVINAPPWTTPDPLSAQPYNGAVTWSPKTKLDLNLNLGPQGGPKRHMVLIKIIVRDPNVTFRTDGFAITAGDVNGRKMFCQIPGGYGVNEATFVAFYYKPTPHQPTMGTFNLGLVVKDVDPAYILPIFVDPAVENNGID